MNSPPSLDETHDPDSSSWVASANDPDTDFPLQNLPFGTFMRAGAAFAHIGVRIGDAVLDLTQLASGNTLPFGLATRDALCQPTLNRLMALGREAAASLRHSLFTWLADDCDRPRRDAAGAALLPVREVRMALPAAIGDFTDFYTSIHHARRAGAIARPESPLSANFTSMPIAYHGRASSIAVSGTACRRPHGQSGPDSGYRPSTKLDFELEFGCFVGAGKAAGRPLGIDEAEQALFGCCLVNDWSARDIQRWEATPLGPFLSKSFLTTISPWIVTFDALAPFRHAAPDRDPAAGPLAAELSSPANRRSGAIDVRLAASLQSRQMRQRHDAPLPIAGPAFKDQYWTLAQMLVHHTSNGCALRAGDLLSSGTVSGADPADSGCLLERTRDGHAPIVLPGGETRGYLQDGDVLSLSARCERAGYRSIGFGECRSEVVAALQRSSVAHRSAEPEIP